MSLGGLLSENDLLRCVSVIAAVPNSSNKIFFFFHKNVFYIFKEKSEPIQIHTKKSTNKCDINF